MQLHCQAPLQPRLTLLGCPWCSGVLWRQDAVPAQTAANGASPSPAGRGGETAAALHAGTAPPRLTPPPPLSPAHHTIATECETGPESLPADLATPTERFSTLEYHFSMEDSEPGVGVGGGQSVSNADRQDTHHQHHHHYHYTNSVTTAGLPLSALPPFPPSLSIGTRATGSFSESASESVSYGCSSGDACCGPALVAADASLCFSGMNRLEDLYAKFFATLDRHVAGSGCGADRGRACDYYQNGSNGTAAEHTAPSPGLHSVGESLLFKSADNSPETAERALKRTRLESGGEVVFSPLPEAPATWHNTNLFSQTGSCEGFGATLHRVRMQRPPGPNDLPGTGFNSFHTSERRTDRGDGGGIGRKTTRGNDAFSDAGRGTALPPPSSSSPYFFAHSNTVGGNHSVNNGSSVANNGGAPSPFHQHRLFAADSPRAVSPVDDAIDVWAAEGGGGWGGMGASGTSGPGSASDSSNAHGGNDNDNEEEGETDGIEGSARLYGDFRMPSFYFLECASTHESIFIL